MPRGDVAVDYCDGMTVAVDGCIRRALERAGKKLNSLGRSGRTPYLTEQEAIDYHTTVIIDIHMVERHRLLSGAWDRAPEIASWYGLDSDKLVGVLESYCRNLLTSGTKHDFSRTCYLLNQIS